MNNISTICDSGYTTLTECLNSYNYISLIKLLAKALKYIGTAKRVGDIVFCKKEIIELAIKK